MGRRGRLLGQPGQTPPVRLEQTHTAHTAPAFKRGTSAECLARESPREDNAPQHQTEENLLPTPTPRQPLPDMFLGWHEAIHAASGEKERAMLLRARGWWALRAKAQAARRGRSQSRPRTPLQAPKVRSDE